jgi:hypothetical protein
VLLAFDLAADRVEGLAGFAVACTPPDTPRRAGPSGRAKDEYFLQNRLNFSQGVSAGTPFSSEQWMPSNKALFQTFRWGTSVPVSICDRIWSEKYQKGYWCAMTEIMMLRCPKKTRHNP